ncbi:hypothetical protein [Flavobacterium sp. Arc2]|uniref:hypothetical protein n=1 Tax=Flavobacterium sp. Arc2 TaxID=3046685 RepID=UPI00352F3EE1
MTNNKNVLRVLNGYLELSSAEKMELRKEIDDLVISGVLINDSTNTLKKREISVKMSANLGPTNNNNCKCCGKG